MPLAPAQAFFESRRFSRAMEMARVLVAEDDEDILLLLETVLEDAGFVVAATSNVAAAMRVLEAGDVDCVLTDLGLPGQSGMVLAEAATAAGIPVIVATGGLPESEALATAGWQLLQKPFRLQDLVTTIATALAGRPGAGPVIREFLETMAERCRLLADRAEGDALARELMIIADEMRSRAAGAL
jgi:DNA-binding NtrC family response regulator